MKQNQALNGWTVCFEIGYTYGRRNTRRFSILSVEIKGVSTSQCQQETNVWFISSFGSCKSSEENVSLWSVVKYLSRWLLNVPVLLKNFIIQFERNQTENVNHKSDKKEIVREPYFMRPKSVILLSMLLSHPCSPSPLFINCTNKAGSLLEIKINLINSREEFPLSKRTLMVKSFELIAIKNYFNSTVNRE